MASSYTKLTPREHVLLRPGMYIGSLDPPEPAPSWVSNHDFTQIVQRCVAVVPAVANIFDEVLVNAIDHCIRTREDPKKSMKRVRNIRVTIPRGVGPLEVWNDGQGIDVVRHDETGVYIPELIFGHFLTSTNYEGGGGAEGGDPPEPPRIVGGQNGLGAKVCNVFSASFEVETLDASRGILYRQTWGANMASVDAPEMQSVPKSRAPFTRVSFVPDYARLNVPDGIDDDTFAVLAKRVVDTAAITPSDVSVVLNGVKIETKNFERYMDLYLDTPPPRPRLDRAFERVNEWWEVGVAPSSSLRQQSGSEDPDASPANLRQVSFVNGVWTSRGGKHVDYITSQIVRRLTDCATSRAKEKGLPPVRPHVIRDNLVVFVRCTIPDPTFDSQSKDTLTTPVARFGKPIDLSERFFDRISKTGIVERALEASQCLAGRMLARTDGKKETRVSGVPKLEDAHLAGTSRSSECTLILTEGDSAKAMAMAGVDVIGRQCFGVFPLRGKLLNTCDATSVRICANAEICALKKIIGLESGREYDDVLRLRYGRILIMTDQDADGSHIKGLVFNLFHSLWPSLLKLPGRDFLASMRTPLVKCRTLASCRHLKADMLWIGEDVLEFYSLTEFQRWRDGVADIHDWRTKYYKGLGTSTAAEAKRYFTQLRMTSYVWNGDASSKALALAFDKKRADERKAWLQEFDRGIPMPEESIDVELNSCKEETSGGAGGCRVAYEDFVHRELIHFSNHDLERSIPCVCDGLKTSQRKVLWACIKRDLRSEVRVAQLAGYVSEHAAYHHGEASLTSTIVGLAQDFVGSNNVNLLLPIGQFGTRIHGGRDAGSPRYIHTALSPITWTLFRAEDADVLEYLEDDGLPVEPRFFVPVLPLVLLNGAVGIGTGFSTSIPCFDPREVAREVLAWIDCATVSRTPTTSLHSLKPWYRRYRGIIGTDDTGRTYSRGIATAMGTSEVKVSELPLGVWTQDYKEFLEAAVSAFPAMGLKGVRSDSTDTEVDFVLKFADADKAKGAIDSCSSLLRLESTRGMGTSNMYLYDHMGRIRKYKSPEEILDAFCCIRRDLYERRKDHILAKKREQLASLQLKIRFLEDVISGKLVIHQQSKAKLVEQFREGGYGDDNSDLGMLLGMPLSSLTREKMEDLQGKAADLTDYIAGLEVTNPLDIWHREVAQFVAEYEADLFHREKEDIRSTDLTKRQKSKTKTKAKTITKTNI